MHSEAAHHGLLSRESLQEFDGTRRILPDERRPKEVREIHHESDVPGSDERQGLKSVGPHKVARVASRNLEEGLNSLLRRGPHSAERHDRGPADRKVVIRERSDECRDGRCRDGPEVVERHRCIIPHTDVRVGQSYDEGLDGIHLNHSGSGG